MVEVVKRIFIGRSYVLSFILKFEEGKEEEVMVLCKGIVSWVYGKMVIRKFFFLF